MTDKQDPIAHAARLLREAAGELRQAHAYNNSEGWENETDAKDAYDEHLAAAQALEDWEAAVGAGGVQPLPQQKSFPDNSQQAQAAINSGASGGVQALSAAPAPAIGDELRDTLVAVSAAIAEQDDRAAQKMICDILAASPTPPAEQPGTPPAGWLPVHSNGRGFYGGPLKTEDEAKRYISQVEQSNDSVTLIARAFVWADEQQNARPLPLPWPWTEGAQVLNDAINHIDGQDRLKNALRVLASTTYPQAAQTPQQAAPKAAPGEPTDSDGFGSAEHWKEKAQYWAGVAHRLRGEALRGEPVDGIVHPPAPQQEAQEPTEISEAIERMAADRYKVVPSHESMFHRWAVVAGTGTQQLYLGREVECQNMARKFAGAFLDGAFVAMQRTAPQPAPAPLSDDVVKDAARWRMVALISNEVMLHPEKRTHATVVKAYMDATHSGSGLTGAVDAAIAAQGGK